MLSSQLNNEELKRQKQKYTTINNLYSTKGQAYNEFRRRPMRYVIEKNLIPDQYNKGSTNYKEIYIGLQLQHINLPENRIRQLEVKCFSDNPENIAEDAELFSIQLFIERLKVEGLSDARRLQELSDTLINARRLLDSQQLIDMKTRQQLNDIITSTYHLLTYICQRGLQIKGAFEEYVKEYDERLTQYKALALRLREQDGIKDWQEIGAMMLSVADGLDFLSQNSLDEYSKVKSNKHNTEELFGGKGYLMTTHTENCFMLKVYGHVSNNLDTIDKYSQAEAISRLYPGGHNHQRYKGVQIYSIREALHYEWFSLQEEDLLLQKENQWVFKRILAYGYANYNNEKAISVNPFKVFKLFKEMGVSVEELVEMPEEKFSALLEIFLNPSYIYQKTDGHVLKCIGQNQPIDDEDNIIQYDDGPLISNNEILTLSANRIRLIVKLYNRYLAIPENQMNVDGIDIDDRCIRALSETIKNSAIDDDRIKKIEKACLSNDPGNAVQDLLLLDIRLYAEELMRSQNEVDAASRIKAGKKLAAVCDNLADYNRREMSDDDRELLNEMITKTALQVGYARTSNADAIRQGEETYKTLAEKIGNRFDSRFVAKAFGWIGLILLVVGGFALSPLTAGFSGVLATAATVTSIGGLAGGGVSTLGGWGAFFYKKSKVKTMQSVPGALADIAGRPEPDVNDLTYNDAQNIPSTNTATVVI